MKNVIVNINKYLGIYLNKSMHARFNIIIEFWVEKEH